MKKLFALILALAMTLSLTACGGESAPDAGSSSAGDGGDASASSSETGDAAPEDTSAPEDAEETPTTVQVTIPSAFLSDPGETEAADIESAAFMGGILDGHYQDYSVNEDGSVTLTMTAEQHQEALSVLSSALLETMASSFPDEETYPSIKAFELSDDLKSITLTVDHEAYESSFDAFALYVAFYACEVYHVLEGDDAGPLSVAVSIVDEATGDTVETYVYPDDYETEDDDTGADLSPDSVTYTAEECPDGLLLTVHNGNSTGVYGDLSVVFYDEAGNLMGEGTVFIEFLPANCDQQYACLLYDRVGYASYEISLSIDSMAAHDMRESLTIEDSLNEAEVVTRIENSGQECVDCINLICAFYDQDGALVHLDSTFTTGLEPGQFESASFIFPYDGNTGRDIPFDRYEIIISEAYSY